MLLCNTQGYTKCWYNHIKCVFNMLQPFHRIEIWDIIIMDMFIFLCIDLVRSSFRAVTNVFYSISTTNSNHEVMGLLTSSLHWLE